MTKHSWKLLRILCILGLCTGFINRTYGLGFALGAAGALLIYGRISAASDVWISQQEAGRFQVFSGFLIDYTVMAGVLILAALKPEWFNIFAAAAGLGIIKITTVAELIFTGKGDVNER